jgi:hypothetical protein
MKKRTEFGISSKIIEIPANYENQAKQLASSLTLNQKNVFIEIDCMPNGHLNSFNYNNGTKSAKTILEIAGSFLGDDRLWLEQKIGISEKSTFIPNYGLGEGLGLWKRVRENDYRELINWNKPFCVKNDNGLTKIWHPGLRKSQRTGSATRSAIIVFIREQRTYLQSLFTPLKAVYPSSWNMSYRLVFFCSGVLEPEFIGGLWISRSGLKIYPDKNSIVGLISTQVI